MSERFELKFRIAAAVKNRLLESSREGLEPDPHGRQGVYRVTSQYYDTPDLEAYWEKLDGVPFRRKFRLRFYDREPRPGSVFLEVKSRSYETIHKSRVLLDPELAARLLEDPAELHRLLGTGPGRSGPTLETIALWAAGRTLRPVNVISYLREAWIGTVDPRLRVTFDHMCRAYAPGDYRSPPTESGAALLPLPEIILEVKFDRRIPVWLRDMLVGDDLLPVRFSKYVEGVGALRALPSREVSSWVAHGST